MSKVRLMMVAFSVTLLLTGCGRHATKQVTGPNNTQLVSVSCSFGWQDMSDCMAKAAEMCPNGYEIVDSSQTTRGAYTSIYRPQGYSNSAQWNQALTTRITDRKLLVECNGAA